MNQYVMALDQGTTSSRAILFDRTGAIASKAQLPFSQIYPSPGWVEHNPLEIWETQRSAAAKAVEDYNSSSIVAIGITNQRETTILWDKKSGEPVYNAIVWQCRRTAAVCDELKKDAAFEALVRERTGLIVDAYFSGTKIKWILDQVPGAREKAERGELLFGTIETWLIWNLTRGKVHVTDYSNASRTMLFNIHTLSWDKEICAYLGIPMSLLPTPVSNSEVYGSVAEGIQGLEKLAGVPICGAAGDQQAALFGQGCFSSGEAKNTYGTGCFTLMNTGSTPVISQSGLLTSVAWNVNGKTSYVLEGSVFNAGSAIQWLRDELKLISSAHECDVLAECVNDAAGVFFVPAFTGLGAPYWDMYARGTFVGITRGASRAHIARATLEAIAFEVCDLMNAMSKDSGFPISVLRVDGGASVSNIMMQFQADLLRVPVDRPVMVEATAFGAAALAGLAVGFWKSIDEVRMLRRSDRIFVAKRDEQECSQLYQRWQHAVKTCRTWTENS